MLLNKPFNVNDIISFRLTTGEEIVARYSSESLTDYIINKPASLTQTPQGNIALMPTLFSAELNSSVTLQKKVVAMVTLTNKKFSDEYTRATSSIKPASSLEGLTDAKGSA
jgi:hypothetical protein